MNTQKRKKYTVAQRIFKKLYLPYIKSHVLNSASVSYLTLSDIDDNWGEYMSWDARMADEIILQSKMFFQNEISSDSASLHNPDVLEELAGYIIDHLAPYFVRAPQFQKSADSVREYLTEKIKTRNVVLAHARMHRQMIQEKKLQRATCIAAEAVASAADTTSDIESQGRHRRPRVPARVVVDDYYKFRGSIYTNTQNQK